MRVLVLYAHPDRSSYGAALHRETLDGLEAAGHTVDDCDLYAEGFDPVMTYRDRIGYYDTVHNRQPVENYVDRLEQASALVIVSPVWTLGFPAILKGYFDRVWLPGVSFTLVEGRVRRKLTNIVKLGAVMTYGAPRMNAFFAGDPPRKLVTRLLRSQIKPMAPVNYVAHYDIDRSSPQSREQFLKKVRESFTGF
ncbi:NAD(P)H-dependent oxidoreductase [Agrobacterium tumefaciens]|uniref:NAD(P)H-dependent oxidoreductase n=1 Tax=Agrobacterium tumefaciens TaxID=358 RepID=UPI002243E374|nr:NAD(P)H-dependent oxidoreductase [Agrobacterium tumefaciens]MCW8060074.1 NAD(P)H-dependent oxidoreductase [Agrobacterium tumefaciens]MCW8142789.1 NAD(P)H-dependent oxidoreductase [Agrobacterium tumefaciens]